jgi:hypothetical protein
MELRTELPDDLPLSMRHLPLHRGYPVPYFVAWLGEGGTPYTRQHRDSTPDFRVIHPGAREDCIKNGRCWVCGQTMRFDPKFAFVSGPMCGVTRTSAEPPSHLACGRWSAKACPFLARPHARRRDIEHETAGMPGIGITRNPGVAMVWITKQAEVFPDGRGDYLVKMGDPVAVEWYAHGREATREEVEESITTGIPFLMEVAQEESPEAVLELTQMAEDFREAHLPEGDT